MDTSKVVKADEEGMIEGASGEKPSVWSPYYHRFAEAVYQRPVEFCTFLAPFGQSMLVIVCNNPAKSVGLTRLPASLSINQWSASAMALSQIADMQTVCW